MRISATTLESYRLYRAFDWMTTEDMVATATGTTEWTPAMRAGTLFEAAVDGDATEGVDESDVRGVQARLPEGRITQAKVTLDVLGHEIVAKADYLHGLQVRDLKTTQKSIKIDRYLDSLQWRVYLEAFGGTEFWYDVVQIKLINGIWTVKGMEQFVCYPYPSMRHDIEHWVDRYVSWHRTMGLEEKRHKEIAERFELFIQGMEEKV